MEVGDEGRYLMEKRILELIRYIHPKKIRRDGEGKGSVR
jgi:hypothetical protein